ncbi:MAG: maleylpyruvate isomerase N-terminal domain-containing protein, partial [Actinomycetota bacterium]|nr:maleylpyruvate isomerase N-terminal domain-containing protein [Actinomycetota bacterium]
MTGDLRTRVLDDLAAEGAALEALVAGLDADGWRTATPAPGWTIAHQVAHLAWTDEAALLAATDPGAFGAH